MSLIVAVAHQGAETNSVSAVGPFVASAGSDGFVRLWDWRQRTDREVLYVNRLPEKDVTEVQLTTRGGAAGLVLQGSSSSSSVDASSLDAYCICGSHLVRIDWRKPKAWQVFNHSTDLCAMDATSDATRVVVADEDAFVAVLAKQSGGSGGSGAIDFDSAWRPMMTSAGRGAAATGSTQTPPTGWFGEPMAVGVGLALHHSPWMVGGDAAPTTTSTSTTSPARFVSMVSMDGILTTYGLNDDTVGGGGVRVFGRSQVGSAPRAAGSSSSLAAAATTSVAATSRISNPPMPVSMDVISSSPPFSSSVSWRSDDGEAEGEEDTIAAPFAQMLIARGDGQFVVVEARCTRFQLDPDDDDADDVSTTTTSSRRMSRPSVLHEVVLEAPGHQSNGLADAKWCPSWLSGAACSSSDIPLEAKGRYILTAATSGEIFVWDTACDETAEEEAADGLKCCFAFNLREDVGTSTTTTTGAVMASGGGASALQRAVGSPRPHLNAVVYSAWHQSVIVGDSAGRLIAASRDLMAAS